MYCIEQFNLISKNTEVSIVTQTNWSADIKTNDPMNTFGD